MSMLALPETECQEILALFRQHLPHVPDNWLQELAGNYGLDAVVDIDPNDVISILSVSGELHQIRISLAGRATPDETHLRLHEALAGQGIETVRIISSLLTIHHGAASLADVCQIAGWGLLGAETAIERGWAWYKPQPLLEDCQLNWLVRLSG